MHCPKCKDVSLTTKKVKQTEVELDQCPECKGLWFDADELTVILGQRAQKDFVVPEYAAVHKDTHCPECQAALYEFCYPGTLTLVDACRSCSGVWLDNLEWKEIIDARDCANQMICPKCSAPQKKADSCQQCGIIIEKYVAAAAAAAEQAGDQLAAEQAAKAANKIEQSINTENYMASANSSNIFKQLSFVSKELKDFDAINKKPSGGVASFLSRVGYALSLGFKEKEIMFFGLLQWVTIGLGYLLWVQMLDWIPEEVWRSAESSNKASAVDLILIIWSFVCIGLAAFPIGILTGCMGATHFLHRQGKESTVARCFQLVLPQSWALWSFHWIDGWITVKRIFERLPRKNDNRTLADKALAEALYYAWKVGVAGVLPSILTGSSLVVSGKNSIYFVKSNFMEVARLRAGYSILCWILGIAAYIGGIFFLANSDIVPKGESVDAHIYTIYTWIAVPILIATAFLMLFLRPVYVLAICDLYSDYLESKGEEAIIPEDAPAAWGALAAFVLLCIAVAITYVFRVELGIVDMLSTPYSQVTG